MSRDKRTMGQTAKPNKTRHRSRNRPMQVTIMRSCSLFLVLSSIINHFLKTSQANQRWRRSFRRNRDQRKTSTNKSWCHKKWRFSISIEDDRSISKKIAKKMNRNNVSSANYWSFVINKFQWEIKVKLFYSSNTNCYFIDWNKAYAFNSLWARHLYFRITIETKQFYFQKKSSFSQQKYYQWT